MKEIKSYEVYAFNMRDAQICTASDNDIDNDVSWKNFEQEPLIDIVNATSEEEACNIVAKDNEIHPDALYAVQRDVRATGIIKKGENGEEIEMRTIATPYSYDNGFGIEILLPDQRIVRVENAKDGSVSVYEINPEAGTRQKVCMIH